MACPLPQAGVGMSCRLKAGTVLGAVSVRVFIVRDSLKTSGKLGRVGEAAARAGSAGGRLGTGQAAGHGGATAPVAYHARAAQFRLTAGGLVEVEGGRGRGRVGRTSL